MYQSQVTALLNTSDSDSLTQQPSNSLSLPFHVNILPRNEGEQNTITLADHLPATYRGKQDHIFTPSFDDFEFLQRELLVKRLDDVQQHLWTVGRPMPPRPLHHQLMLSRSIVITESMELHLVWSGTRIFIKPIPSYLLDPAFWSAHILGNDEVQQAKEMQQPNPEIQHIRETLSKSARGFLFTYTALIAYESDFRIAQENGLIPTMVTWDNWKLLAREILHNHRYSAISPRFWYGELRLSRLNSIYRWRKGLLWRGYSKVDSHITYEDLLRDNFALLASVLGYVVIVITAMQLGISTDRLAMNNLFQDASYGITVLAIMAPLIIGVIIFGIVLFIIVYNWMVTKTYEKRRFREMGLLPDWRGKDAKVVEENR